MGRTNAKVAWSDVCLPKIEGGLGVPNSVVNNKANMVKHIRDLASKKDSLWVKWCHIYLLRGKCLWNCKIQQNVSWTWLKIMKLRDSFHEHITWGMGLVFLLGLIIGILMDPYGRNMGLELCMIPLVIWTAD